MNLEKYEEYRTLLQTLSQCAVESQRLAEKYSDDRTENVERVYKITEAYSDEVDLLADALETFFNQSEVTRLTDETEELQRKLNYANSTVAMQITAITVLNNEVNRLKKIMNETYGPIARHIKPESYRDISRRGDCGQPTLPDSYT